MELGGRDVMWNPEKREEKMRRDCKEEKGRKGEKPRGVKIYEIINDQKYLLSEGYY